MNGTVKFFNEEKGFGFIKADDGKEFFVHKSALDEGVNLRENDAVTFDVEDGDRGPKAVNVKLGQGSQESTEESSEESSEDNAEEN